MLPLSHKNPPGVDLVISLVYFRRIISTEVLPASFVFADSCSDISFRKLLCTFNRSRIYSAHEGYTEKEWSAQINAIKAGKASAKTAGAFLCPEKPGSLYL